MKRKSQLGGVGSNPSHLVNLAGDLRNLAVDLRNSWFFRDLRRRVRNNRQPIMNTTSASLSSGKMSTKSSSWRNFTTTSSNQNRGDAPSSGVIPLSHLEGPHTSATDRRNTTARARHRRHRDKRVRHGTQHTKGTPRGQRRAQRGKDEEVRLARAELVHIVRK